MNNKEIIKKILNEETKGLNMRLKDAKNFFIFSYNDLVEILERALKLKEKEK